MDTVSNNYYKEKNKLKKGKLLELISKQKNEKDKKLQHSLLRKIIRCCFKIGFLFEFIKDIKKSNKYYMKGMLFLTDTCKKLVLGKRSMESEFLDAIGFFNYKITNNMMIASKHLEACIFFNKTIAIIKEIGKKYEGRDREDFLRKLSKQYGLLGRLITKYNFNYTTKELKEESFHLFYTHPYYLTSCFSLQSARKFSKMIAPIDSNETLEILSDGYHSIPQDIRNRMGVNRTLMLFGLLMANEYFLAGDEDMALIYYTRIAKSELYFEENWPILLQKPLENGLKISLRTKKPKEVISFALKSLHPIIQLPHEIRVSYQKLFFETIQETHKDYCVSSNYFSKTMVECKEILFLQQELINEEVVVQVKLVSFFPLPLLVKNISLRFEEIQEKATTQFLNFLYPNKANPIILRVVPTAPIKKLSCVYITMQLLMNENEKFCLDFKYIFKENHLKMLNFIDIDLNSSTVNESITDFDMSEVDMNDSILQGKQKLQLVGAMKINEFDLKELSFEQETPRKKKEESFILSPIKHNREEFISPTTPRSSNIMSRETRTIFVKEEEIKIERLDSKVLLSSLYGSVKGNVSPIEAKIVDSSLIYHATVSFDSFLNLAETFDKLVCVDLYHSGADCENLCTILNSLSKRKSCSLEKLVLSKNKLNESSIKCLGNLMKSESCKNLEILEIWNTNLNEECCFQLKESLKHLKNLREINIGNNKTMGEKGLISILSSLKDLANLSKIGLSSALVGSLILENLNAQFSFHSSLSKIDLSYNEIDSSSSKHLIELLQSKSRIVNLFLDGNKLLEPKVQGKEKINESGVKFLRELAKNIEETNYSICFLSEDQIELPEEIKLLLERNNQFIQTIGEVKKEKSHSFIWKNKSMSTFPSDLVLSHFFNNKSYITKFDLSNNKLDSFPSSFFASDLCCTLAHINLSGNKFRFIPEGISRLKNLSHLDMSFNLLEELSPEISKVLSLKTLLLTNNKITSFPAKVLSSLRITSLDISVNEIEQLPSEIKSLVYLESLSVQMNKISSIPSEMLMLKKLEIFNISNNLLNIIQPALSSFWKRNNCQVDVRKNPFTYIPSETVHQGNDAILEYLSSLEKGSVSCNRVKLVFTGSKKVGRNSLLKSLLQDKSVGKNNDTFKPIEWVISDSKVVPEMRVNVIDIPSNVSEKFHQLFYNSEKTVHVLVFELTKYIEEKNNKILYFLETIKMRAPNSSIFIVGTHCESVKREEILSINKSLDELFNVWKNASRNLVDIVKHKMGDEELFFFPVSSTTMEGITSLRGRLYESFEKIIENSEKVAPSYLKLIEIVQKKSSSFNKVPIISWEEFKRWGLFTEEEDCVKASQLLHRLGYLFSYRKTANASSIRLMTDNLVPASPKIETRLSVGNNETEFDKFVCLDPQYLIKIMGVTQGKQKKALLKNQNLTQTTHQISSGNLMEEMENIPLLNTENFESLLKEFPPFLFNFCLQIIFQFDLWYPINKDTVLSLSKLKKAPKHLVQGVWKPNNGNFFFSRIYVLPFLPSTLFPSLVVRLWKFFDCLRVLHSNYCYLKNEEGEITIRFTKSTKLFAKNIEFYVESSSQQKAADIMFKVNMIYSSLMKDWYSCGARFENKSVCYIPCSNCISAGKVVGYFNFCNVLECLEMNKPLSCGECSQDIPVKSILPEIWEVLSEDNYFQEVEQKDTLAKGGFGKKIKI